MAEGSKIEWTDHTFNPWWGCAHVSPGCVHCYAEAWDKRTGGDHWGAKGERRMMSDKHWREPFRWDAKAGQEERKALVFCASMADVFEEHPALDEPRARLWNVIRSTPNLIWQLLTKRPENVTRMVPWNTWPENVWLGTSVENQEWADKRIPLLCEIPARVRFLSCEPLIGPVDLSVYLGVEYMDALEGYGREMFASLQNKVGGGIDWIIVGGESGPGARPMHPKWAERIRDQAEAVEVPFLFKQWGVWAPEWLGTEGWSKLVSLREDGSTGDIGDPDCHILYRTTKHRAGRFLDGKTYDGFPPV